MRPGIALIVGCVMGCAKIVPATPLAYASAVQPPDSIQLSSGRYQQLPSELVSVVTALHGRVDELVQTTEFRQYLEDIDALLAKAGADPISGRRFASIYLGGDPKYQHLPVCYTFESGGGSETARTGLGADKGACNPDGKSTLAFTTLRSVTVDRGRASAAEANACAVNTFAHEWSHAIAATTGSGNGHAMVFEDDNHDHQPGAVASYVVGAVAQCLYLKHAYKEKGDFDVRKCVESVGTNAFDPRTCAEGWGQTFSTTTRVGTCD